MRQLKARRIWFSCNHQNFYWISKILAYTGDRLTATL